jgi:YVTN family beta-propeller protein
MNTRKRWALFSRTALTLAAFSAVGTASQAAMAQQAGTVYLYACNQGEATISVIDPTTMEVVTSVSLEDLGFTENAKPHHVVVEPDGSHWYVSLIGANQVLKFDRDNRLVGQVEFEVPGMLALHPTEPLLLVGRSMSAVNPPQRIGVIERDDPTIDEWDVFFPRPHALAVHPDGETVYSASLAVNQIAALDPSTGDFELTDLAGDTHTLVQFAISPDGNTMVATTQLTGKLLFFDLGSRHAPRLTGSVAVGAQPWHPVFTPDGAYVFFGNKGDNSVTVVDVRTRSVATTIRHPAIAEPHGSAVSPDGRRVFISSNNTRGEYSSSTGESVGTVVAIDVATLEVVDYVEVGLNTTGLGMRTAR